MNKGGLLKIASKAGVIVLFASLVAVLVNSLSSGGIPIRGSSSFFKDNVAEISPDEAWLLFQKRGAVFVDSRDKDEFAEGHIQGAISLPIAEFDHHVPLFMDLVPVNTPIVTYCNGKGCDSSLELAELLLASGYKDVKVFFGGWQHWQDAGHPVEKSAGRP